MSNSNDLYYNGPTQLKYFDEGTYHGAIGYHDFLIDGDSASVIPISAVLERARQNGMPDDLAIVEFDWVSLDDIILYGKAV